MNSSKGHSFLIEIDVLAKACGLPTFRYHAFPPVHFDIESSVAATAQTAPETILEVAAPRFAETVAAAPVLAEPVLTAERAEPVLAPPRREPVFAAPRTEPILTEAQARPIPAAPEPEPRQPPATAQPPLSASRWLAQRGTAAHPSYPVLQEIAAALGDATPPDSTRARPSRRRARSAGSTAISALRSN